MTQRIEALKWEKSNYYEKVQGALSVLDLFNTAKCVAAGQGRIEHLNEAYNKLASDPEMMDYFSSVGHATYDPCSCHPILEVFNTMNRITRGEFQHSHRTAL